MEKAHGECLDSIFPGGIRLERGAGWEREGSRWGDQSSEGLRERGHKVSRREGFKEKREQQGWTRPRDRYSGTQRVCTARGKNEVIRG